ncbi:LytR/AlgR family response regulator transcription factor [Eubacterium coprostanoligenes]|uniref:LytR/AlgR family response regulator transcription factor n=1 Tax=Eubacterium coprostanoligenes TaxID=290054 RepID=UPI0023530448|nr:LytTR family DNA-binding domain-containing protein [Eubacterium coprostanoligenes]MCI6254068.1 LytTR family DNA-binding domain-containing protein [Eubacterium coprostanoligenes]MDY5399808.1 LytTR family DNA-binding domain-containing protein [Eubacterium coprostanoligenes]
MRIAICDDQQEYRKLIIQYVQFYFQEHLLDLETYEFGSGEELLSSDKTFDIIFLDIEMNELNGIQTTKELNIRNKNTIIFIVTAYQKYLDDAMDLNVFRYIDKPIQAKRLYNGLDKAIDLINNNEITFKTRNDGIVTIHKNDIIYVEVKRKIVYVNTTEKQYIAREKMDFFKENLTAPYFAIPHISYVINFNFVKKFQRDNVQLKTGQIISIAPKKQTDIKKKFMKFMGEGYGGLSDSF